MLVNTASDSITVIRVVENSDAKFQCYQSDGVLYEYYASDIIYCANI